MEESIGALAEGFEGSLSGLGIELGTLSYNMADTLLALPMYKQEGAVHFQYILAAPTSPAVKINEPTLTYLNQAQPYEIKLKKVGDLTHFLNKTVKTVIRVCFHERKLQASETQQIAEWRRQRPQDRILDIDLSLSYGLSDVYKAPHAVNVIEFSWNTNKETGAFIIINCMSTEFTVKKHGGEKGVPFRISVDTFLRDDDDGVRLLHGGHCQVKVFKPKGADRKNKVDRERFDKRPPSEQMQYQESYECTVFSDSSPDDLYASPSAPDPSSDPQPLKSSPDAAWGGEGNSSDHSPTFSGTLHNSICTINQLALESDSSQVQSWLIRNRFSSYCQAFSNFSGEDLMRLSRSDLVTICGLPDGIRLDNTLHSKPLRFPLVVYVCQQADPVHHALYLEEATLCRLQEKVSRLFNISITELLEFYLTGPGDIYIMVTDEVVKSIPTESCFTMTVLKDSASSKYRIVFKSTQT